eukprot:151497-Chlamydomonas_euryale.AAC.1
MPHVCPQALLEWARATWETTAGGTPLTACVPTHPSAWAAWADLGGHARRSAATASAAATALAAAAAETGSAAATGLIALA